MIGKDSSPQSLGIVPCAISWLFRLIEERKERTGTRFSVRVSALEVCGPDESLRDLLAEVASGSLQDAQSPGMYLREDPVCGAQVRHRPRGHGGGGTGPRVLGGGEGGLREAGPDHSLCAALPSARPQLPNQSELRAPTAEKAAWYLDAALAARSARRPSCSSHLLFTLHVYQYRVEKCGRGGSRCRLVRPPPALPAAPGGSGVRVPWGPRRHLPALCFQCLGAAAACISSTWAAVRGRPAGAGRPPGDPRVCLCRPWAVSSWPWSAGPSMCPTGEWWAPRRAGRGWPLGSQPRAWRARPVGLEP